MVNWQVGVPVAAAAKWEPAGDWPRGHFVLGARMPVANFAAITPKNNFNPCRCLPKYYWNIWILALALGSVVISYIV